ncbi:type II secretion system F family protein, partial [bacterium]|nr:type II secretion system F family protein [bacterium]
MKRTASEKGELVEEMHRDGLFVIQITDAVSGRSGERRSGFTGKALPWRKRGIKVKGDLLVSFTRQLATMVSAGLPLIKIMRGLASEQEPKFGEVLRQVSEDVEQGSTFSEALRKQPRVFNQLFTALVESGEESGQLDVILDQLADYMEATRDIRMRVKSALRYPMFIF